MKRVVFILITLLFAAGTTDVQAQWLKKLGQKAIDRAEDRAKKKVEKKVDDAVDKTVDNAFEGAEDAVKGEDKKVKKGDIGDNANIDGQEVTQDEGKQQKKSAQISWNKFDFVAGDEIIFEDNQANEQLGEFPSQWDVLSGGAEIASIDGVKCIEMTSAGQIVPLMEKPKGYLPDNFTIEFDIYMRDHAMAIEAYPTQKHWINADWYFRLLNEKGNKCFDTEICPYYGHTSKSESVGKESIRYFWSVGGENRSGNAQEVAWETEAWHHISISFNKRAMKMYFDQTRLFNIPNMDKPTWFVVGADCTEQGLYFIKNVRIAKGAVPLYDRMMTDGKFITYGITFDVGKSTIKPESMGEINRIVKLMTDNPDLKFSVEGHTDSTGNAASNQTLSEARSKAIVDKLVELGISADRLASAGKGQDSPIADNSTDEGRAKNRRVEFVKQ
ncbi:MAG: OmpA family protein [Bacteroides sp.]|jgi:outer membrane protein, putative ompA domain protein|uniref:OmpA family protein n=1 Tax=Bacteroides sp. TaxID=29523 RepID=UPI0025C1F9B3|nr:OmpA family protein [Bacteroides sp.]MBS6237370.1 OmpA family protein [Bacteroides sp.]